MGFFVPVVLGHSRLFKRRQRRRRRGQQLSSSTRTEHRLLLQQQQQPPSESPHPSSLWKAAAELAVCNFFGQALYNWGIASVSSARASFLGQTTVVLVPLLLSFSGEALQMWDGMGCLSSLVGLILFSVENGVAAGSGGGGVGDSGSRVDASSIYYQNHTNDHDHQQKQHSVKLHLGLGEVMILCSAVCWSFCLIGTSKYAHAYDTIYLQGAKNALLAVLCTLWWLITIVPMGTAHEQEETVDSRQTDAGHATTIGSTSSTTMTAWLILIYSALGPGILADLIQQQGQAMATGATGSNLILCMESLFTAVLGRLLLGEETSWIEKLGGACLVLGALISSRDAK